MDTLFMIVLAYTVIAGAVAIFVLIRMAFTLHRMMERVCQEIDVYRSN